MILDEKANSQVLRDFPRHFVISDDQLTYLVNEMKNSLYPENENQITRSKFIWGLSNGLISQSNNLEELVNLENNRQQRIIFLIISTALFDPDQEKNIREFLIYFSTGSNPLQQEIIELSDGETFNLNFEGVSYRIYDSNRSSALDMLKKFDDRIKDYLPWYSSIWLDINLKQITSPLALFMVLGLLLYFISQLDLGANPFSGGGGYWGVQGSVMLAMVSTISITILLVISLLTILVFSIKIIELFLPPSYFSIGVGKKSYTAMIDNWKQFIWAVPVALAVSFLVWLLGF